MVGFGVCLSENKHNLSTVFSHESAKEYLFVHLYFTESVS